MRLALRIVSVLTILCIPAGVALILATAGTGGDISPLLIPGFALIAFGILLAITSALLGIIATAMRRQFAWLIGIIVAVLIPIIGVPVINILASQASPEMGATLANTVGNAFILGGPILVALVVFIYSFGMRTLAPVGSIGPSAPSF